MGYATYPMEGYSFTGRWGHQQSKGGSAILVKKTLNHTPGAQERLRKASAQTIRVGDCIIGTGYAPPHEGPQEDLAQLVAGIAQAENWQSGGMQQWCFAADFNAEGVKGASSYHQSLFLRGTRGWPKKKPRGIFFKA